MKLKLPHTTLSKRLNELYPEVYSLNQGIPCFFERFDNPGYEIKIKNHSIIILHNKTNDLVMALGDLALLKRPIEYHKSPPFTFRGIMLDVSRNGVARIEFLKDRLARLSLLGLNYFCLYTEDTYEVSGEPLFGYGRGRYTKKEIRELVKYAKIYGVELFPCIQTLGHMEQVLKYKKYDDIKDTFNIYNVYSKEVYSFIEKTIREALEPYETDIIHIGLDETHGIGRGKAFHVDTPINPHKIYSEHIKKVAEICHKLGVKPIMWGDMVIANNTLAYQGMKNEDIENLPKTIKMNYWDYNSTETKQYSKIINKFKKFGYKPLISPGAWTWNRFFCAYHKAEDNIKKFMTIAKEHGLTEALNTQWGDDGQECFFDYGLPAHTYFLCHCTELNNHRRIASKKFQLFFGSDYDDFIKISELDKQYRKKIYFRMPNLGKCIFYDDPVLGFVTGIPSVPYCNTLYKKITKELEKASLNSSLLLKSHFELALTFAHILCIKSDLRKTMVKLYKKGNKKALKQILKDVKEIIRLLVLFKRQYRNQWHYERKPFGLEVVYGRIGAQEARLDYLHDIVSEYLSGKRTAIEEFEMKNIQWDVKRFPEFNYCYSQIITKCAMFL